MSAWDAEVGDHLFYSTKILALTPSYITVLRDVRERGRDIEGIIKQWFAFVKPSYTRFVEPQRQISGTSIQFPTLIV
jgi:Na+/H+-translocating membrane pyrophosphatase